MSNDWADDGLCAPDRGRSDWKWFPTNPNQAGPAKETCGECPARGACLEKALDLSLRGTPVYGIWAGTTERERRLILKGKPRRCPDCGTNVAGTRAKRCEQHAVEALAMKHKRWDERRSA